MKRLRYYLHCCSLYVAALSLLSTNPLFAEETQRLYLSGHGPEDAVQWDFYCSGGQHSGRWSKIAVPSCWELQGFGDYTYGRWYLQKGARPSDETGHYKTTFTLPGSFREHEVRLVFEGVMTDARVLINGQQVGEEHQGGFTRFDYTVTPFLRTGRNQLEVFVAKESANPSVNEAERKADWWLFGGIYRPVYLEAVPYSHIEDLCIDARADGHLRAEVGCDYLPADCHLEVSVCEAPNLMNGGEASTEVLASARLDDDCLDESNYYYVDLVVPSVGLWDPEHPHLYYADFALITEGGEVIHTVRERIGFRTVEFRRHDGLYLNGTRLIVKGTNRHCFYPVTGRTLSRRQSIDDALLIREMNMNAVRCHYPSDTHFLDACDSLGLLYLCELPGWQTAYDDSTAQRILPEVVLRDRNHPCVFLWSNGNEGGWNRSIDHHFADYDRLQQRHVIHPWGDWDGIDTHHYPPYQMGMARFNQGHNVFMPTEFLHGLYDRGQGAGLDDYWQKWTSSRLFAGGFLWCMVDEAVRRTDRGNILDTDGRNAPDGIVGAYREREASFYAVREVWSPIQLSELPALLDERYRCLVTNRYLFTNLRDCRLRYQYYAIDSCPTEQPTEKIPESKVLLDGTIALPDLQPGESAYIDIPDSLFRKEYLDRLPQDVSSPFALRLSAIDPMDNEVCTWSVPLRFEGNAPLSGWPGLHPTPAVSETADSYVLVNDSCTVTFDKATGYLRSIERNGKGLTSLTNGPRPVGIYAELTTADLRTTDTEATLVCHYRGGIDSIVWRLAEGDRLCMDAYMLSRDRNGWQGTYVREDQPNLLGLTFDLNEADVAGMSWVGRGPYRVWKNRVKGQQYGLHYKAYNDTRTGVYEGTESVLYPEFKGYHAEVSEACVYQNRGNTLDLNIGTPGLYLQMLTPREPDTMTKEKTMEPFPEGNLSLLYEIPAIRSYKPIEQLGPNSQPAVIRVHNGDDGLEMHLMLRFK